MRTGSRVLRIDSIEAESLLFILLRVPPSSPSRADPVRVSLSPILSCEKVRVDASDGLHVCCAHHDDRGPGRLIAVVSGASPRREGEVSPCSRAGPVR